MTIAHSTSSPLDHETAVPRRWSAKEYLELAQLGYFDSERVELIDGEILTTPPIRNARAAAVSLLTALLSALPTDRYWVRVQATLALLDSYPDPDLAVVEGPITSQGDYPSSTLLIAEVSDSTLRLDRGKKASLYAAAGIPEYWIVNLQAQQIEVHTAPIPDVAMPFGKRYRDVVVHQKTASISPAFSPSLVISVKAVLS